MAALWHHLWLLASQQGLGGGWNYENYKTLNPWSKCVEHRTPNFVLESRSKPFTAFFKAQTLKPLKKKEPHLVLDSGREHVLVPLPALLRRAGAYPSSHQLPRPALPRHRLRTHTPIF